jgi:hypothetical protein
MPNIVIGSKVWGHYSCKPDSGQAGDYRGIVRDIRDDNGDVEYFVEYEDGIREWTSHVRSR